MRKGQVCDWNEAPGRDPGVVAVALFLDMGNDYKVIHLIMTHSNMCFLRVIFCYFTIKGRE